MQVAYPSSQIMCFSPKEFEVKKNLSLAAVLAAAFVVTACGSKGLKELPPPPGSDTFGAGVSGGAVGGNGLGGGSAIGADGSSVIAGGAAGGYDLTAKTVYFAYDSAEIDTAGQGVITNYSRFLTATPGAKLRLEGHTDERGSAEYNVALGERRAQTVAREMKAAGVTDGQLSIVSYGKERPAVPGSTEEAYAKNRRVEITQP